MNAKLLWKAIETIMKAIDQEENPQRKADMLNAVQHLTDIHKSCLGDYE